MEEHEYILKPLAQRLMKEVWHYKKQTRPYVHTTMEQMDPQRLLQELDVLNLRELRQIQGCGVPGSAWTYCNELIQKRLAEIDIIIKKQGQEAFSHVGIEAPPEVEQNGTTGV